MIEEREVITLLLGVGVFALALAYRRTFAYLRSPGLLLASLSFMLLGWVCTNLESAPGDVFDRIEHGGYALSSISIALWAYRTARR